MLRLYEHSLYRQTDYELQREFDECGLAVSCWLSLIDTLECNASELGYTGSASIDRAVSLSIGRTVNEHLRARLARKEPDAWKEEVFHIGAPKLSMLSEDLALLLYGLVAPEPFDYEYISQGLKGYNRALLSWFGVEEK